MSAAANGGSTPTSLVIFGASGDLTRRKLVPSLFGLFRKGRLPPGTRVLGTARARWDDGRFRELMREGAVEFVSDFDTAAWDEFAPLLHYSPGDIGNPEDYRGLGRRLESLEGGRAHRLYYLAVAPRFFPEAVRHLGAAGLACAREAPADVAEPCRSNIVIEKPFGRDARSAAELNDAVQAVFREDQIYRIDHYLGKETAQNILYFRFANTIFEPIWSRNYVDNVQITVAETVDVGHRAGYYDQAGVLRDMFQNHLLQLLTLVAMEPPAPYNATTLRNEKVKVLSATRPVRPEDVVYAQYDGYCAADGVADGSRTPTFAAMRLCIDNWRWQGVPFYLRSGKALARKTSEIVIEFKRPPYKLFSAFQSPTPNALSLCIQPDEGLHLRFDAKVPDRPNETQSVDMEFHYSTSFNDVDLPDAYERLLLDALTGDASLFARNDEIDRAWGLIDPLISDWERSGRAPEAYAPGSWGPEAAERLLGREGREWRVGCGEHAP